MSQNKVPHLLEEVGHGATWGNKKKFKKKLIVKKSLNSSKNFRIFSHFKD